MQVTARVPTNTKPCVFCDRSQYDWRLVAESQHYAIFPTQGQLAPGGGHTLIIPKHHVECVALLTGEVLVELEDLGFRLREATRRACGVEPLIFEHGGVGQTVFHAHQQSVPYPFDPTQRVRSDFRNADIEVIRSLMQLAEKYRQRQQPYLYWQSAPGIRYVCWDPPAPPAYFKKVVAGVVTAETGIAVAPNRDTATPEQLEVDQSLLKLTIPRLRSYFS